MQMDRTLTTEQKRIDFRPPEDLPPPLDRPTDACLFATALLTAAAKAVQQALQGSNGAAFTSEVSQHLCLQPHAYFALCSMPCNACYVTDVLLHGCSCRQKLVRLKLVLQESNIWCLLLCRWLGELECCS